ncbi:hypothetical protein, partial [Paraburkholderia sacchari]|uniref:hypothetical protein n=1 Tax=Paraburkholderia sacchari TaxID=159450 RepID=UPI0039A450AB
MDVHRKRRAGMLFPLAQAREGALRFAPFASRCPAAKPAARNGGGRESLQFLNGDVKKDVDETP